MKKFIVFIFCLFQSLSLGAACANQPVILPVSLPSYVSVPPNLQVAKPVKNKTVRKKEINYKKLIRIAGILILSGVVLFYVAGFLGLVGSLKSFFGGKANGYLIAFYITGITAVLAFYGGLVLLLFAIIKREIERKRQKKQAL